MSRIFVLVSVVLVTCLASACERSDKTSQIPETTKVADKTSAPGAAMTVAQTEPTAAQPTQAVAAEVGQADKKTADHAEKEGAGSCGHDKSDGECAGGCDQWNEAAGDVTARKLPANAVWTTLAVEGMTCGGCEQRIIANVGTIDGILGVEADAELGQVRIATVDGEKAGLKTRAAEKIATLGYRIQ